MALRSYRFFALCLLVTVLSLRCVAAQIPTACSDAESLGNLRCCPDTGNGVCGSGASRGNCMTLNREGFNDSTSDVRLNWPHFYTEICRCNENYAGYDCGRCAFGYYGADCSQNQVLPRRPLRDYSDEEWREFRDIMRMTRTCDSGYSVILEESVPGNVSIPTTNASLYLLYVWVHHYTAKDSQNLISIDYSHTGPAFFTWHRLHNLWFEWEIQGMLQEMGRQDYHTFRLPYWDWRSEIQTSFGLSSEELFSENRLGATRNVSRFPRVFGDLYDGGWDTVCWLLLSQICDPNVNTGPLQRCPFTGTDPCTSSNPDWPDLQQVNDALAFEVYDVPNYDITSSDGFRSFVDFEVGLDIEECRNNRLCFCAPNGGPNCETIGGVPPGPITLTGNMHFLGHIIPGEGDVTVGATMPDNEKGTIEDVAASPNDPLFIVHHAMIDCILEEWLARNDDTEYPVSDLIRAGHRRDDFVTGFFPLYTNNDMFRRTRDFGYSCMLSNITRDSGGVSVASPAVLPVPVMILASFFLLGLL